MTSSKLRVAVLCSHRAPGLSYLLERDPNRGRLYDIVCCLSSEEETTARPQAEAGRIPFLTHPIRSFCRARNVKFTDLEARRGYDRDTIEKLRPFTPDLVLLAGYLLILTAPMLRAFPERIVNVHGSDLTNVDETGRPRYVGLRSVRDAILAGERETRATAHLVTERLDEGPLLAHSEPFPVSPLAHDALRWNATDVLKAYAFAHQEWMLGAAWGPLFVRSIEILAERRAPLQEAS